MWEKGVYLMPFPYFSRLENSNAHQCPNSHRDDGTQTYKVSQCSSWLGYSKEVSDCMAESGNDKSSEVPECCGWCRSGRDVHQSK